MKKYNTEEERKAAKKESWRKWYEANKEQRAEYHKQWRENNPDYHKEYSKEWHQEHPEYERQRYKNNKEHITEQNKKWREANPDYNKEYSKEWFQDKYATQTGRAYCLTKRYKFNDISHNRGECTITPEWMVDNTFKDICFYCDESDWHKLGCDRINNDLPHTPDNVVCSCWECNKKRGRKEFVEFLKEIGRLDKLKELKNKVIITDEVLIE